MLVAFCIWTILAVSIADTGMGDAALVISIFVGYSTVLAMAVIRRPWTDDGGIVGAPGDARRIFIARK
jgi:hypothetical protein